MQSSQETSESVITTITNLLQRPDMHQPAYARSIAAESAITRVTYECSSRLDRITWFNSVHKANVEYQSGVRDQIQDLHARLSIMVEQCGAELHVRQCAIDDARQQKELQSHRLRDLQIKRRNELCASGESKSYAELQVQLEVLSLGNVEVVALLR